MFDFTITIKTRILVILLAVTFCFTSLIATADAVSRPKAPGSIKVARLSDTKAKITWKNVKKANGYIIYQKKNSGKYKKIKTIKKSNIRKWTAKKLGKNNTYRYKIKAYKKYGTNKVYSRYSKVARLNPVVTPKPAPKPAPPDYGTVLNEWAIGSDEEAGEVYDVDKANENVTATMYSSGVLLIKGTAAGNDECMYGEGEINMPWLEEGYSEQITKVLFRDIEPTNIDFWFAGCTALTGRGNVPDSVTDMRYTFAGCTGITDLSQLTIPDGVTNMQGTFGGCNNLTDISGFIIPDSVTGMSYAFYGCSGLSDISGFIIPDSAIYINGIFEGCTGITDLRGLTIPDNVTDMDFAFRSCTGITDLDGFTIPDSVTNMTGTFEGCSGITTLSGLVISDNVIHMNQTFYGCSGITDLAGLSIPDSVTDMGTTFYGCTKLGGEMTINGNPSNYISCFRNAATDASSTGVTVDYTAACTNIDNIIATKSAGSNIVKGSLITP